MEKEITFGGGCYWCTEAMFRELKGVISVKSGFSGGNIKNPSYKEVCTGRTGHAEVIHLVYDPELISLERLLLIHLTTHDPTTLNRQGGDVGTQYRSVIFYANELEKAIAEKVINEVQVAYDNDIVTEIMPFEVFYEAEESHQDYYKNNTEAGYCQAVISPKLKKFREKYSDLRK
ncbi:MAG: peptide-methionine (S)-S-oxide reductase MsrA [Flavobacteriales bacterium]|nr:peptide-methionine (S)-S-oxide reductase MsrA [Flavobacteriales bacterium]